MTFSVTILGSNSATPVTGRFPTAQVINHLDRIFLADCGEGTQIQLNKYNIRLGKINHIFISHLHGDHFYGLIGLVTTFHLFRREQPLFIYGPAGIREIIEVQLQASQTTLVYPLHIHVVDTENVSSVYEDERLTVSTIPMKHRIPTCGYLFREKPRPRKMKPEIIDKLNIPLALIPKLKSGRDFTDENGVLYKNEQITIDPAPPRTYAFCSDTAYQVSTADIVANADLLYHEATFMNDRIDMAHEKFHSTTVEAATLAKAARVRKLIIGHYSARYDDLQPLLEEAKTVFQETYLAVEGAVFNV
ncbi:MAG TPA: ribonuclease Z [Bacteroidales bacterium]|nr:ribonuclease Z [Bacteroidales bacterium]